MWKRLRLATMIAVAMCLGWLSFPTWQPLLRAEQFPSRDRTDSIELIVPGKDTTASLTIDASIASSASQPSGTPELTADLSTNVQSREVGSNIQGLTSYIIARGNTTNWMDSCQEVRDISFSDLPPEVQIIESNARETQNEGVLPERILEATGNIYCENLASAIWWSRRSSHTFVTPRLHIRTFIPGRIDGVFTNYKQRLRRSSVKPDPAVDGPYCTLAQLSATDGLSVDFSYPRGETVENYNPLSNGVQSWKRCPEIVDESDPIYIEGRPVTARFTDTVQSGEIGRQDFFAGIFVGVLGALGIEVLNGFFEVAESSSGAWTKWRRRLQVHRWTGLHDRRESPISLKRSLGRHLKITSDRLRKLHDSSSRPEHTRSEFDTGPD